MSLIRIGAVAGVDSAQRMATRISELENRVQSLVSALAPGSVSSSTRRIVADDAARLALTPIPGLECYVLATEQTWLYSALAGDWVGRVNFGASSGGAGRLVVRERGPAGDGAQIDVDGPLELKAGSVAHPGKLFLNGTIARNYDFQNLTLSPPGGDILGWPAGAGLSALSDGAAVHEFLAGPATLADPLVPTEEHWIVNAGFTFPFIFHCNNGQPNQFNVGTFAGPVDVGLAPGQMAKLMRDPFFFNTWRLQVMPRVPERGSYNSATRTLNNGAIPIVNIYRNGPFLRKIEMDMLPGDAAGGYLRIHRGASTPPAAGFQTQYHPGANVKAASALILPREYYAAAWIATGAYGASATNAWYETDF